MFYYKLEDHIVVKQTAEVSASEFFRQYPDFVQSWRESIVPGKGIGMPTWIIWYKFKWLSSSIIRLGIDQREFYNGEFGNDIPVGMNDICECIFWTRCYYRLFL